MGSKMIRFALYIGIILVLLFQSVAGAGTITTRPKLIVGGDHDCPPYEFTDNGTATGFDVELMRAVADVMGFDVEFRLGPWSSVRQELEQGKIDALAGMYYSTDRSRLVDFSVPHTMVSPGIFVRKGSPIRSYADIQGREVIVQKGDIIDDSLGRNGLASRIVEVTDAGESLKLLASGKYDCAVMPSRLQGEYYVKAFKLGNIRYVNTELPQLRYCFAVRKGNQELLNKLDEGLKLLKVSGKYREIHEKWFGVYEEKDLWQAGKYYVLALVLVAVFCLVFLVWSWTLKRQVAARTAELRRSEEALRFTQYAIDNSADQAFWMTEDGHLFYVNDAACSILGYPREELVGMSIPDIDPTHPPEVFAEHWRNLRKSGSVTMESLHRAKDGRVYPVEIRANYVVFDGREYNCAFATDITDRKRMAEELQHAHDDLEKRVEERTAELAETVQALLLSQFCIDKAAIGIYQTTFEGDILSVNDFACRSLGYTSDELRAMKVSDIDPVITSEEALEIKGMLDNCGFATHESVHRRKDGTTFPVEITTNQLEFQGRPYSFSFVKDITERKRAEEAVRQANLVVENSPVVLFRWRGDDEWPVELVSGNIKQFGYTPDEFLSGSITYSSIILPDDLDRVTREVHDFCDKGADQFRLEYRIMTRERLVRWVNEHTNVERDAAGGVKNFEGIVIDITERKLAEEELERQKLQLQELNRTLEDRVREEVEKNREKDIIMIQQNRQAALGVMLDHIAHQWKQPLSAISFLVHDAEATWACGEMTDDYVSEAVARTMDLVKHMAQTIEVFRDFYRPEKKKTTFNIKDSIDKALSFISPALRFHAIALGLDVDPGLTAIGFPKEYIQVLLNIMTNARDVFVEKRTEKPRLEVKAFEDGTRAVVTISDNAGGIPDEIIDKVFDIYFTTRESSGGTGVGLYMSKNIIEKNMGGKLYCGKCRRRRAVQNRAQHSWN